jgi:hypothetical protein
MFIVTIARCLTALACLGLCACTPGDDGLALQTDYLQRLNNVLEGDSVAPFDKGDLTRYRMPPRRERLQPIAEVRIGLLDLLIDVRRCPELQQLISQRNSILGKQLVPSRRLAYEGDLLRAIETCLPRLTRERDQELRATLGELAEEKRRQLLQVFWNALNGSAEVERYLRFADRSLPVDAAEDNAALDALAQLADLAHALPQRLPPPASELDPLFFALHASEQGGELITSLASLSHNLNQGSELLESRQRHRPVCPLGQATPRGRILQNIFVKYYAGALQPYLAEVDQRGQRWNRSLRRLLVADAIPPAMRDYLSSLADTEASLWDDFQRATARHVRAWQATLKSCGLAPGQAGWESDAIGGER